MGDGERARAYHEATKHSYESVRRGGRFLDWERKPHPFKVYGGLEREPLAPDRAGLRAPTGEALKAAGEGEEGRGPDLRELSTVLWLGAGAQQRRRFGMEEMLFRTYASAGALYPNEVYVATGGLDGLSAGLYHLDPAEPALTRLRSEDPRPYLAGAAADQPEVARAQVTLVVTGIPWRTGWKYGERGYRHLFWDAGMILANLVAVAGALGVAARVVVGFDDGEVEALLGLRSPEEVPLCLVALGDGDPVQSASDPPGRITGPPLSGAERFPRLDEAHEAGRLRGPQEVRRWREGRPARESPAWGGVPGPPKVREVADPLGEVILRRGSARGFVPTSMPLDVLGAALAPAATPLPADTAPPPVEVFLTAHAVDDLPVGAYRFAADGFEPLLEGDLRRKAAFLCLEQRLGGESAVTVFLLGDLEAAYAVWGDRGYRVAQLAGSFAAGRVYLAAYALGYGATGLTFYDDEVVRLFEPASQGMEPLLVVAVGESAGRSDLRPAR